MRIAGDADSRDGGGKRDRERNAETAFPRKRGLGSVSGILSDRYGSRPFATGGMIATAVAFVLLERLPTGFWYAEFAAVLQRSGAEGLVQLIEQRTAALRAG